MATDNQVLREYEMTKAAATKESFRATPECMMMHGGMDELIILGVTHKSAQRMAHISSLVIPPEEQESQLKELKEILAADELVYISTCNRVSFIVIARREPHVLLKVLRSWFIAKDTQSEVPPEDQWVILQGRQALDHLLLVASSLDSMVVGEIQILGQFKQAFVQAKSLGISGPKTHFLYEQILAIAKKVYANTHLTRGKLSIFSLAESSINEYCGHHHAVTAVLVGSGKMIEKAGALLSTVPHAKMIFVNRTKEKSDAFTCKYGGTSLSLEDFLVGKVSFDVLITSTSAPHYLFGVAFFKSSPHRGKRLLIDLAIPPDVDPAVSALKDTTLISMETLRKESEARQEGRGRAVRDAQAILTAGAEAVADRWRIRSVNPAIGAIRLRYERESLAMLNKLIEKELLHLDPNEKELLSNWVRNMSKHWAVLHAAGIKQVARQCCFRAITTYLDGMGVERSAQ